MTIHRLCSQCGAPNERGHLAGLCPTCKRADNRRRNKKRVTSGRTSTHWLTLRKARLELDGYRCQLRVNHRCTGLATTVHLDAALAGDHTRATLDNTQSACLRCHGSIDAPRSHSQRAGSNSPLAVEDISVG